MDKKKNYYSILGVLPSAEGIVIKAAYKALIKVYHPDVFNGSKEEAHLKTVEINEAYSVLSNKDKRAEYDRSKSNYNDSFEDHQYAQDPHQESAYHTLDEEWELVSKYSPKLIKAESLLSELSSSLVFSFRAKILETKKFNSAISIARTMKNNYLNTYFGDNKEIQDFAIELIKDRQRDAARELNKVVKTLGAEIDAEFVINKIIVEFSLETEDTGSKVNEFQQKEDKKSSVNIWSNLLSIGLGVIAVAIAVAALMPHDRGHGFDLAAFIGTVILGRFSIKLYNTV